MITFPGTTHFVAHVFIYTYTFKSLMQAYETQEALVDLQDLSLTSGLHGALLSALLCLLCLEVSFLSACDENSCLCHCQ